MKRTLIVAAIIGFLLSMVSGASASPIAFSDDFNDGNADGWLLGHYSQVPGLGNWRVENGTLIQDFGGDA